MIAEPGFGTAWSRWPGSSAWRSRRWTFRATHDFLWWPLLHSPLIQRAADGQAVRRDNERAIGERSPSVAGVAPGPRAWRRSHPQCRSLHDHDRGGLGASCRRGRALACPPGVSIQLRSHLAAAAPALQHPGEVPTPAASAKERDGNNFPISRWLGNSAIVPFGKNFVKDDLHALLESRSILPAGFVYLVEEADFHLQSGGRFGLGHVVLDGLQRVEDHSSTRPGQMREQAVLNRIVLRTVRRVMGHADLDAQPVRQFLEVLLE